MKNLATVIGICSALLLGGFALAADSSSPTLARIVEKKEVRIGMSGSQPPFTMKAKDGKLIGFEVDVAKGLAAAMGVKLKLVQKPFAELPALVVTLARNPDKKLMTAGALLTMEPIGVALPAGDSQLMTLVTSMLTAMQSTGKIDERADYRFKGAAWLSKLP